MPHLRRYVLHILYCCCYWFLTTSSGARGIHHHCSSRLLSSSTFGTTSTTTSTGYRREQHLAAPVRFTNSRVTSSTTALTTVATKYHARTQRKCCPTSNAIYLLARSTIRLQSQVWSPPRAIRIIMITTMHTHLKSICLAIHRFPKNRT